MEKSFTSQLLDRFAGPAIALCIIIFVGSVGYWLLTGTHHSMLKCVFMTIITITTIGYKQVIPLDNSPIAIIFTIFLALGGIGTFTYLVSSITAFVVEGEMTEAFRRRTMERKAGNVENHYIVCGAGKVGLHIVQELCSTQRPCVAIDLNRDHLHKLHQEYENIIYLEADSTDNDTLTTAGIDKANGIFAVTDDDNQNLVISLSAKQLNPNIHVVARCNELKNADKIKAAGANAVVSPSHIGGLRMASEMVRPTAVSFLDIMLRDKDKNLRVEEVTVPLAGKKIADLDLQQFPETLLLAVRTKTDWKYNPSPEYTLDENSRLVVMTTPTERNKLEGHLAKMKIHA